MEKIMNNIVKKIDFLIHLFVMILICTSSPVISKTARMQKLIERRENKIKQIESKHKEKQIQTASTVEESNESLINELPFTLFIYGYNNKDWIKFNLDSVLSQEYTNYRIIYLDDASDDNSNEIVKKYLHDKKTNVNIEVISNTEHQGKLKSMYALLHNCRDEEIIILLNGCDWLSNNYVLRTICKEYINNDIWLTFGSCTSEPKSCNIGLRNGSIPQTILETKQFRKIFPYMPAQSFYAGLFKRIKKNDLIDPTTNDFYAHAVECYVMWPLLEMANTHFKAISEITYVVNCTDPIARLLDDYHLRMACNNQMGKQLPIYQAVSTLYKE